jgi:hypothetical protein
LHSPSQPPTEIRVGCSERRATRRLRGGMARGEDEIQEKKHYKGPTGAHVQLPTASRRCGYLGRNIRLSVISQQVN